MFIPQHYLGAHMENSDDHGTEYKSKGRSGHGVISLSNAEVNLAWSFPSAVGYRNETAM